MRFLDNPPRHLFFTGKGGVGKTSIACASAVVLARRGKRVLLVSTDPASNVGQVFGTAIGNRVTAITQVPGLSAIEIDPAQAAADYREKILAPVRALLPPGEIAAITEQLSGSCTTEIASFNEFTMLLADPTESAGFDHVIFDTAPTGHTIRLLQLPGSWTSFLDQGKGDASCLGPMSGLEKNRATYRAAVQALTDPGTTRLVLVARAQTSTLSEVARTHDELSALGIHPTHLVLNGVLPPSPAGDSLHQAIRDREQQVLANLPATLTGMATDEIALKPTNMVGLPALEHLFSDDLPPGEAPEAALVGGDAPAGLSSLIDDLEAQGHGLVMTMERAASARPRSPGCWPTRPILPSCRSAPSSPACRNSGRCSSRRRSGGRTGRGRCFSSTRSTVSTRRSRTGSCRIWRTGRSCWSGRPRKTPASS